MVLAPSGRIVTEAPNMRTDLILSTIDPRETRLQRIRTPLERDERLHLTRDELERIHEERYRHDGRG